MRWTRTRTRIREEDRRRQSFFIWILLFQRSCNLIIHEMTAKWHLENFTLCEMYKNNRKCNQNQKRIRECKKVSRAMRVGVVCGCVCVTVCVLWRVGAAGSGKWVTATASYLLLCFFLACFSPSFPLAACRCFPFNFNSDICLSAVKIK